MEKETEAHVTCFEVNQLVSQSDLQPKFEICKKEGYFVGAKKYVRSPFLQF